MKSKHKYIRNKLQSYFSQLKIKGYPITFTDKILLGQVIIDHKQHGRFRFHQSGTIVQISDSKTNQILELDVNQVSNILLIGFSLFFD